jgi:hypothetical protein
MSTRTLLAVVLFVILVSCAAFAQYPPETPPGVNPQRDVPLTAPNSTSQQTPLRSFLSEQRAAEGVAAAWWQVRLTAVYVAVTGLLFVVAGLQLWVIRRQLGQMQEAQRLTQAQLQLITDRLAVAKEPAKAASSSASAANNMR